MKRILNSAIILTCVAAWGACGLPAIADDDQTTADSSAGGELRVVAAVSTKYWIGIQAVPITDALKSQLNLEDRLMAGDVIPDGPAAKGGIEKHDILLKFGDREVKKLHDLFQAISDNEDKATNVVVLRQGKKTTLEIRPADRPDDAELHLPNDDTALAPLGTWLRGPAGTRLRVLGPGVLEDLPAVPGNLTISITRNDDKPAKIIVKRDDDMWMITEDEIDQLPEDIRKHVQRRLDHPHGQTSSIPGLRVRIPGLTLKEGEDGTIRFDSSLTMPEGTNKAFREQMQRAIEQLEKARQHLDFQDPLKALQQEMKALRLEFEKLREQNRPAEVEESDTKDV